MAIRLSYSSLLDRSFRNDAFGCRTTRPDAPQTTQHKETQIRKVIASTFVTLDGYMVGPNEDISWGTNNFNEEMAKYAGDLMNAMDTILLGRVSCCIMNRNESEDAAGCNC